MNGDNFDRVLQIQEKSILAWEKTFNIIENLIKSVESLDGTVEDNSEKFEELKTEVLILKEAMKAMMEEMGDETSNKKKDRSNEVLVRWMKIIGAAVILVSTIIGAILAFTQ